MAKEMRPTLVEGAVSGYITRKCEKGQHEQQLAKACHPKLSFLLSERGLARFEVLGLDADRDLIRSLARRLAEDGPEKQPAFEPSSAGLFSGEPPKTGGILAALRRSPLVGADLGLSRPRDEGREIEL